MNEPSSANEQQHKAGRKGYGNNLKQINFKKEKQSAKENQNGSNEQEVLSKFKPSGCCVGSRHLSPSCVGAVLHISVFREIDKPVVRTSSHDNGLMTAELLKRCEGGN
ncbi:MAG: hypothetical protein KAW94_05260, partial [Candidatus Thorarchaeota archaeon]|nr:hypothetical protein [Candidatus Thorarchaeota archaeon]